MNEAELKAGNQQSKIGKPQARSGFARILARKTKHHRDSSTVNPVRPPDQAIASHNWLDFAPVLMVKPVCANGPTAQLDR